MGSKSDWETMRHAVEVLEQFGVPHEAHRLGAPHARLDGGVRDGREARGIEVIIAGAGGAAHLPGMVAAHTRAAGARRPGQSAALKGLDSLLSIVQMPGGVPVGDAGHRQGGRDQRGAARRGDPRELAARAARAAARVSRASRRAKSAQDTLP